MRSLPRPSSAHLVSLVAASLASCAHESHDAHIPPPPAGPPVYYELEPNDSPSFPDTIGYVDPYSFLYVDGHVEAFGFDVRDCIEFVSAVPAAYDFRVDALSPFGDVDVTIYDPIANVVVAEYFFAGSYEVGRIFVHQSNRPFQIIVEAWGVDTEWSLELVGLPYHSALRVPGEPGEGEAFVAVQPLDVDGLEVSEEQDAPARDAESVGDEIGDLREESPAITAYMPVRD